MGMDRGLNSATLLTNFSDEFGSSSHEFSTRSYHDQATIGSRSGFDHDRKSSPIVVGSCRGDSASKGVRLSRDRGSIAKFFHDRSAPSDEAQVSERS